MDHSKTYARGNHRIIAAARSKTHARGNHHNIAAARSKTYARGNHHIIAAACSKTYARGKTRRKWLRGVDISSRAHLQAQGNPAIQIMQSYRWIEKRIIYLKWIACTPVFRIWRA